ncbi:MAG: FadR/GntR family transcriptional regulator [Paenibacillus dendritiformis]|uniref:FadR/GntR family transcriptional regulator n=1 Tax=Paenibacillus dendritiformis TaxID=130049 RepID=UPI00143DD824|nr:FadR/GntR family transcriptional regulator [Paenibacillus dendritiformis]MDU5145556.1 FadR/GntR family transcriptional regulator [Paenibacillus dendritiformis]NKI24029.1 FadR family transcriptional regulator [Paenibacillus dendritiformis]NRG00774.1 FadR family transcriptional regulator [Paenibacillus dendritiformis]GIO71462.1 transcriptional regulator [Paenibacillus dendritiformis]
MNLNTPKFTAVPRRKLVDQVLEQLHDALVSHYRPGDRMPAEPELMEMFGVGRSTVREAVKILVHAGVLEVRQGDGTYVRSLPSDAGSLEQRLLRAETEHIREIRSMMDAQAARLAAERRTDQDLRRMKRLLEERKKALEAGNYASYVDYDVEFHCSIAEASQNPLLLDLYRAFSNALRGELSHLIVGTKHYEDRSELHDQLYQAIAARDADTAVRLSLANLAPQGRRGSE